MGKPKQSAELSIAEPTPESNQEPAPEFGPFYGRVRVGLWWITKSEDYPAFRALLNERDAEVIETYVEVPETGVMPSRQGVAEQVGLTDKRIDQILRDTLDLYRGLQEVPEGHAMIEQGLLHRRNFTELAQAHTERESLLAAAKELVEKKPREKAEQAAARERAQPERIEAIRRRRGLRPEIYELIAHHPDFFSLAEEMLPDRDYRILLSYAAVDGRSKPTLEEIGTDYDVTKERVRQIVSRSIEKISSAIKQ